MATLNFTQTVTFDSNGRPSNGRPKNPNDGGFTLDGGDDLAAVVTDTEYDALFAVPIGARIMAISAPAASLVFSLLTGDDGSETVTDIHTSTTADALEAVDTLPKVTAGWNGEEWAVIGAKGNGVLDFSGTILLGYDRDVD